MNPELTSGCDHENDNTEIAMGTGLGSMLALGAATGFGQIRTEMVAASQVAQFCVPRRRIPVHIGEEIPA